MEVKKKMAPWMPLTIVTFLAAISGVLASFGDAPVSFFMSKKEVKQLLGLSADIYYLREGVKNEYALNFTVIIPADVTSLHFTWDNLSEKPVVYEISMDYSNRVAMDEPSMNITEHGKLPKGRQVIRVDFPCTGAENAEVDIVMGVNVTTAYYMSSLKLKRKKICLKNLAEFEQRNTKKEKPAQQPPAPIPPNKQEKQPKTKSTSIPNKNIAPALPDHVDSSEAESSAPSIAAPGSSMTSRDDPEDEEEEEEAVKEDSSSSSSVIVGANEGGILAPAPPTVLIVVCSMIVFVLIAALALYLFVARRNKQRRSHGRGPSDHDMKYESVDMIFCRHEDGPTTMKRGGSYATIASAPNGNNNGNGGANGAAAITLVTGNGKPLPMIPAAGGTMNSSMANGGYHFVGGNNNNKSDAGDLDMFATVLGMNLSGNGSSHNTATTGSSSDKASNSMYPGSTNGVHHDGLLSVANGANSSFIGSSASRSGSAIGGAPMWGTGGSTFSQQFRYKPPFTPKLGGSGRRIIGNGGGKAPVQQMSHPRITLPPPPPETPPPPAPTYATPIYTQTVGPRLPLLSDSTGDNDSGNDTYHHYSHPHHPHQQATVTEMIKELCMDQSRLRYTELVQEGTYGRVFRGLYTSPTAGKGQDVLIKTVTNESSSVQRTLLLGEGLLMFGLSHPNILTIIGVSVEDRLSLVYPFVNGGNLKMYLNSFQVGPEGGAPRNYPLLAQEVVKMATQVAQASLYLNDKDIAHRDLATRNCVLDEKLRIKVADNALSRDLFPGDYECLGDGDNRPLRWMAPEAIVEKEFSEASDVWAYGVLLWELTTLAQQPYHEVDPFEMVEFLYQGYRLLQPVHCPDELFDLMTSCWDIDPKKRPTFRQILDYLRDFKSSLEKYI